MYIRDLETAPLICGAYYCILEYTLCFELQGLGTKELVFMFPVTSSAMSLLYGKVVS